MRPTAGLAVAVSLVLLASLPGHGQSPSPPSKPDGGSGVASPPGGPPTQPAPIRIGALLPLTGPATWYGTEMRRGLELAIAELGRPLRPERRDARPSDASAPGAPPSGVAPPTGVESDAPDEPPGARVPLALEALDVDPLNPRQAVQRFAQLASRPLAVVFTASATPTLAIHQEAAARDVLVIHQGIVTPRLPAGSRGLIHTRPPLGMRVEALADLVHERGLARAAIVTAGDDLGRTIRAVAVPRWRQAGASVVLEASLSPDTPDLAVRLRELVRLAPDAVLLGFHDIELGEVARALREAGYGGLLLVLDDDRVARLTAGAALDGALIVSDAFVPAPDSRGARFAARYRKRFGSDPSRYAASAYEALAIVVAGIQATRGPGGEVPSGTRLRESLLARAAFPSLYGEQVALRADGVLARALALFTVTRGELSFVRYLSPPRRAAGSTPGVTRLEPA